MLHGPLEIPLMKPCQTSIVKRLAHEPDALKMGKQYKEQTRKQRPTAPVRPKTGLRCAGLQFARTSMSHLWRKIGQDPSRD